MRNSYHLMLVVVVLVAQLSDGQRVSIVERLKALDKGIRQGLQRQKSDLTFPVSPSVAPSIAPVQASNNPIPVRDEEIASAAPQPVAVETPVQPSLGPKPVEQISQKTNQPQLSMAPEDADGTSDVVRQLTESYEETDEVRKNNSCGMFMRLMSSSSSK